MQGGILTYWMRRRGSSPATGLLLLLAAVPAVAAVETTPWGSFEFPSPVRSTAEAAAMHAEAKLPIVIAIRFLAGADSAATPWINRHLACGRGDVRPDLAAAHVRASTLLAHRLIEDLERGRSAAAALRAGETPVQSVRYAGPVAIVLEPARITAEGEAVAPLPPLEPHLRVFIAASVPRCASEATGAFGRIGELAGGFMITASPALELGWPTYATGAFGQRIVMATDNLLAEGFCCGQESAFGLDSLFGIYDYRDYQTKSRLRTTLRALGNARERNAAWVARVRDAFGVPERFPEMFVRALRYGSGRLATGEFVIWPAVPEPLDSTSRRPARPDVQMATLADFVMALAWHAHLRADLISPAVLETYDPQRKYSFVGWPEEFRDLQAAEEGSAAQPARMLEVFGAERRYSFVGEPQAIHDNIEFGFAAWRLEASFLERFATQPFQAQYRPDAPLGRAVTALAQAEADAIRRRRTQAFRPLFTRAVPADAATASYVAALEELDSRTGVPGFAAWHSPVAGAPAAGERHSLTWLGHDAQLSATSVEELRSGLVSLYDEHYGRHFEQPAAPP